MFNVYYYKKINPFFNKILIILLICSFILMTTSRAQNHNEFKVGILLGFTGVVESLTPSMANSAELAFNEILKNEELSKKN